MSAKATLKHARVAPRKARAVIDLIRGKHVESALAVLESTTRGVARDIKKLLNSALANAENNQNLNVDRLFVAEAFVNEGPTVKRWRPRAMGRATRINKRTSHITIVLDETRA